MKKEWVVSRTPDGVKAFAVEVEGSVSRCHEIGLEPSLKIINHSPTGFEYGYQGSGPAQLGAAILLDWCEKTAIDPEMLVLEHHQALMEAFLVKQPAKEFSITERQLNTWFAARLTQTGSVQ